MTVMSPFTMVEANISLGVCHVSWDVRVCMYTAVSSIPPCRIQERWHQRKSKRRFHKTVRVVKTKLTVGYDLENELSTFRQLYETIWHKNK